MFGEEIISDSEGLKSGTSPFSWSRELLMYSILDLIWLSRKSESGGRGDIYYCRRGVLELIYELELLILIIPDNNQD